MKTWIAISSSGTMLPDADGFEQNATIEDRQQGTCGDVAGLPIRRNEWLIQIFINLLYGPGQYPLVCRT